MDVQDDPFCRDTMGSDPLCPDMICDYRRARYRSQWFEVLGDELQLPAVFLDIEFTGPVNQDPLHPKNEEQYSSLPAVHFSFPLISVL